MLYTLSIVGFVEGFKVIKKASKQPAVAQTAARRRRLESICAAAATSATHMLPSRSHPCSDDLHARQKPRGSSYNLQ